MQHFLSEDQRARAAEFDNFAAAQVKPFAAAWDREEKIPPATLEALARAGYLGASLPPEHGGKGWDIVTFGLLNQALGKASPSLTNVLTVQAMVSMALLKWGSAAQKEKWLPQLSKGEIVGAFALTEPGAGSATQFLATEFTQNANGNGLILTGCKQWISCGQFAGVFLVFGKLGTYPTACLVPATAAGLEIEPIGRLMGFRAAGLAKLTFNRVAVPAADVIGKPGFGLSHVAPVGLQYGRISTACSALGMLRGCFEESIAYSAQRKLGEKNLGHVGMIRALIANMGADLEAASLLCYNACRAEQEHGPEAFEKVLIAKYFTSRAAVRAAADAVQIHGAAGCHEAAAVAGYYRDAKITEIIEGTTQIHEELLGEIFVGQACPRRDGVSR